MQTYRAEEKCHATNKCYWIFLQSCASVVFTSITVRVSLNLSYLATCFFFRNDGEFWCKCMYIIARENLFYPWCKIVWYSAWLISYNTVPGGSLVDIIIYRRPQAPVIMWPRKRFFFNCPVPGRLLNSPVMCKSLKLLKSYDGSLICDHNITCTYLRGLILYWPCVL